MPGTYALPIPVASEEPLPPPIERPVRPPVYNDPPVYNPPVYNPPVYNPPVYNPPVGGGCTCNTDCTCVPVYISDRDAKENCQILTGPDAAALSDRLAALPLSTWNYRGAEAADRHLGPMA